MTDPELLEAIMEAREAVEAADGAALTALRARHASAADAVARDLSAAFAAGDEAAARVAVVRLRYATRVLQAATDRM